ncbi:putative protein isoform X2 [Gossypium australe]|uniref:Uncharacterized protein n=1 Tax=Gossypium australe TaxID=47621 RepID=A0A5B6X8E2_9ROSI|nr:putative protein isoform X2 [Gossypium australe]
MEVSIPSSCLNLGKSRNLILFWPGWYAAGFIFHWQSLAPSDDCEWMGFSHLVLWGYHYHTPNTEMLKSDFKASKQVCGCGSFYYAQNTDLCDGFSSATCLRSINFYNEEWRRGALKMKELVRSCSCCSTTDVLEMPGQMLVLHVSCMYLVECTIMKKKKKLQFFCLAAFMWMILEKIDCDTYSSSESRIREYELDEISECPRMLLNAKEEVICKGYEDSGSHSI